MSADNNAPQVQQIPTRSGKVISVRPVTPEDEPLLAEFFDRVSDEDRRFRFLTAHKHLTHEQLAPMVEVDHKGTESFIAFDDAGAVVGHALLACDDAMDTGEIAVSVLAVKKVDSLPVNVANRGFGCSGVGLVGKQLREALFLETVPENLGQSSRQPIQ